MGVIPIATDTGFARDLILDGKNGIVIPNPPTPTQVYEAILTASELTGSPQKSVEHLSWERLANIVLGDAEAIWNNERSKLNHE